MSVIALRRRQSSGTPSGYVPPVDPSSFAVGSKLYAVIPAGQTADVQVTRNGSNVAGASATAVGAYEYTVAAADAGAVLGLVVTNVTWEGKAPRQYGIWVQDDQRNKIFDEYDENLIVGTTVPADYALTGSTFATAKTVTGVSVTGNIVTLTLSSPMVPGDIAKVTYTGGSNKLRDTSTTANQVPSYSQIQVYSDIPPAALAAVPRTGTNMVAGGGGYVASVGADTAFYTILALPSNPSPEWTMALDGWVEMQVADSNAAMRAIGLSYGGGDYETQILFQVRVASAVARAYAQNTAAGSNYTFVSPSALSRVRLRRAVPDNAITMDVSTDGGGTWTTHYTFPATPADSLKGFMRSTSTTVAVIGPALQGFADH